MDTTRATELTLSGFGATSTVARAEIKELDAGARLRRAAIVAGLGLGIAVLTLPIPIVHWFFPWVALVGGMVLGVRRLRQREVFHRVEGACPFCGRSGRWGLTGAAVRLPRELTCPDCRKTLELAKR
jgi:hypothetical protein